MISLAPSGNVPAWAKRLASGRDYEFSYEDVRDIYVYLRSTRSLIERSKLADTVWQWREVQNRLEYVFTKDGFGGTTQIRKIVELLTKRAIGPEVSYIDKRVELGLMKPRRKDTEEEKKAKEYLKDGARLSRARNWQWRLEVAIREAVSKGWYPLFGTYTVDPKRLPEGCLSRDDLWKNTPAWDRFVKKIKTEVAAACALGRRPANWDKGNTFFQYFAVIEHGKSGEHPHVHVIWLCREIPASWKIDPNRNCSTNTEVDIAAASALWQHGTQRKTMALFIVGSWFTAHWITPIKATTGKPTKVGDAGAVAGYIGKYLTKGVTKKWNHRVKATKNLGLLHLIKELSEEKNSTHLLALSCRPMLYKVWMKLQMATSCPLSLIREISKKVLTRRWHSTKTPQDTSFLMAQWVKKPQEFFMTLMLSVQDGAKPWKMTPEHRFNFYTPMLEEVESAVHSENTVLKLIEWLCDKDGNRNNCEPFVLMKGEFA